MEKHVVPRIKQDLLDFYSYAATSVSISMPTKPTTSPASASTSCIYFSNGLEVGKGSPSFILINTTPALAVGPYVDNGDGTVYDESTGLVWQQEDDGTKRTWEDACPKPVKTWNWLAMMTGVPLELMS